MAIASSDLKRHLADYAEVTGRKSSRFICPITLRQCDLGELIDGHIINQAIKVASRRSVIQYSKVDHFYGTRVEPSLVRFLNLTTKTTMEIVREGEVIRIKCSDGTVLDAFHAESASGRRAAGKYPMISIAASKGETADIPIFVKTSFDDPRLQSKEGDVIVRHPGVLPLHWGAAMLKVGFLALFDMIGYRAVFDPCGDTLRRSLASFFNDNARREDTDEYFRDFRSATKIMGHGSSIPDLRDDYTPYAFDTLNDRELLLHFTPGETMFAVSCIFHINDLSVVVMLPQKMPHTNMETAWNAYSRMMRDESVPQVVRRARFTGKQWDVSPEPVSATFLPDPEES